MMWGVSILVDKICLAYLWQCGIIFYSCLVDFLILMASAIELKKDKLYKWNNYSEDYQLIRSKALGSKT